MDEWPEKNSIILMNMETDDIFMNETFTEDDKYAYFTFELCLKEDHYSFILNDRWEDGIQCIDYLIIHQ